MARDLFRLVPMVGIALHGLVALREPNSDRRHAPDVVPGIPSLFTRFPCPLPMFYVVCSCFRRMDSVARLY